MKFFLALNTASIICALFASNNVSAQQFFRCTSMAGKIEFSDKPCDGSRKAEKVQAQGNTVDMSGGRELQLRRDVEQLREQLRDQQQKASSSNTLAPQRTQPDLQSDRIDTVACERSKRDYEVTVNSNYSNTPIVEAKRSMMFGTCGMREPNRNSVTIENNINNTINNRTR